MSRKVLAAAAIFIGLGTGNALANCSLNGNLYPVGTVLCFDTFIQECTVAGFWKAIGNCRADDPRFHQVENVPKIEDRIASLMAVVGQNDSPATSQDK
ncbi:MAG: hypothetical protein AAF557_25940 [Pseudomonadota bacterium]